MLTKYVVTNAYICTYINITKVYTSPDILNRDYPSLMHIPVQEKCSEDNLTVTSRQLPLYLVKAGFA